MPISLVLICLIFVASCNNSSDKKQIPTTKEFSPSAALGEMQGQYTANLIPVNPAIIRAKGTATIVRDDDDFIVDIRFKNSFAHKMHSQNIHLGEKCPDYSLDLNNDGIIDGNEGINAYQKILIPLDADLNSQRMGGGTFPQSDEFGSYIYSQIASFSKMLKDLLEKDLNPRDDLTKFVPGVSFNLKGKVVVIYGVPQDVDIPTSVTGRGRLGPHESIPIACGVIMRQKPNSGHIDYDQARNVPDEEENERPDDGTIYYPYGESPNLPRNYGEGS